MKHMAELEEALERTRTAEKAMKESFETIEKQHQQESELRKELEKKQEDLEDASELAFSANGRATARAGARRMSARAGGGGCRQGQGAADGYKKNERTVCISRDGVLYFGKYL